jgi:hypothetical protein
MIATSFPARNMPVIAVFASLAMLLFASGAALAEERPSTAETGYSDAAREVMDTRIGPKPSASFYLADVLETWGLEREARDLRTYLMHHYVKEAGGQAHDPNFTVGKAIDRAGQMDPLVGPGKDWFGMAWRGMAGRNLRPAFADFPVERPEAVGKRSPEAREVAPGAWAGFDAPNNRSALFVAVQVENRSAAPVPLGAFAIRLEPEPAAGLANFAFDCPAPPDDGIVMIVGGGKRSVICASNRFNRGKPTELARTLIHVQAYPERAVVTPAAFEERAGGRAAAVEAHVKALSALSAANAAPLLARFGKCAKDGSCGEVKPPRDPLKEPATLGFLVFALVVVYWFLATFRSNGTAALLAWIGCNASMAWLVSQGPSVRTGGWDSPVFLVIYAGLMVVPTIAVAILYHTVKWLQARQWWYYPG